MSTQPRDPQISECHPEAEDSGCASLRLSSHHALPRCAEVSGWTHDPCRLWRGAISRAIKPPWQQRCCLWLMAFGPLDIRREACLWPNVHFYWFASRSRLVFIQKAFRYHSEYALRETKCHENNSRRLENWSLLYFFPAVGWIMKLMFYLIKSSWITPIHLDRTSGFRISFFV